MANLRVTIVTITFNNFTELKETLESLQPLNQEFEILVINGGSCSLTKNYLSSNNIKNISEADQGISDAFNKGIEFASGPFIWFVNSGDRIINAAYATKAHELLTNDQTVDYVYGNVIFEHNNLGKMRVTPSAVTGDMPFPHPSLIMRKSLFDKIGKFDLNRRVAMDFEIAYRLLRQNFRGIYLNTEPVILMDGNGISSSSGLRGLAERRDILTSLGFMNNQVRVKFAILEIKSHVRTILGKIRLLKLYDSLKKRFSNFKVKG